MQPLWVIPGAACEASQAATKRHLPEPAGETQGRRYQSTISGPHCSTSKLNWLVQPFPFAFEFCFSTSCSKGWFTGKFSTIPTNPQVERVFKGIESGLSELTLGITAGLRKYFQKSISLKAANAFWLFFFFFHLHEIWFLTTTKQDSAAALPPLALLPHTTVMLSSELPQNDLFSLAQTFSLPQNC